GHPLDAAGAGVAHHEDARRARLQQIRLTLQRPVARSQLLGADVAASLDESLVVERQATADPHGVGHGTRHGEDVSDRPGLHLAGGGVAPAHPFEMSLALERLDLRTGAQRDALVLLDSLN